MTCLVHPQHSQFCPQGLCESSPFLLQFSSNYLTFKFCNPHKFPGILHLSVNLTRPSTSVSQCLLFLIRQVHSISFFFFSSTPAEVFFLFCSSRYNKYSYLAPAAGKNRGFLIDKAWTPSTDCKWSCTNLSAINECS